VFDLSGHIPDLSSLYLTEKTVSTILNLNTANLPLISSENKVRLGACINHVGKLICIGFNSRKHVQEMGLALPNEVVFFIKASSAITGPNDPIMYPKVGQKVDWEAELAFVIGK
jgi:2-keto-4-pentenoate hydratase/2-oxohepta-3-ene-1,7-dioic acid hydratase in catechol pathway